MDSLDLKFACAAATHAECIYRWDYWCVALIVWTWTLTSPHAFMTPMQLWLNHLCESDCDHCDTSINCSNYHADLLNDRCLRYLYKWCKYNTIHLNMPHTAASCRFWRMCSNISSRSRLHPVHGTVAEAVHCFNRPPPSAGSNGAQRRRLTTGRDHSIDITMGKQETPSLHNNNISS